MTERNPYYPFPYNPAMFVIRVIDESSWLIGEKLMLSHTRSGQYSWGDGRGGGYTISDAPSPLPETRPLPEDSEIKLHYFYEGRRAVYFIGDAALKIAGIERPNCTREHVTLDWLHERQFSFSIPKAIHHVEHGDIGYLVMSKMHGEVLEELWPKLDDSLRKQYAERYVDIVTELAIPSEDTQIAGIDGRTLCIGGLLPTPTEEDDFGPADYKKICMELGMDCSKLVFFHCDMTPFNVMVDPETHAFSIIDWEIAGFVPLEWIRTHTSLGRAFAILADTDPLSFQLSVSYRMEDVGYPDALDAYVPWRGWWDDEGGMVNNETD